MTDPADTFRLDHRVALIAGGSGAIGSAMGEALGAAGAAVTIAGRSADRVQAAAARAGATGAPSLGIIADVYKVEECERMVAETVDRFGRRPTRLLSGIASSTSTCAARFMRPRPRSRR